MTTQPDNESFLTACVCALMGTLASGSSFVLADQGQLLCALTVATAASCLWVLCGLYVADFSRNS
jgi:hypothetical protein